MRSHSILSAKSLFSADSADEDTDESDNDLDTDPLGGASREDGGGVKGAESNDQVEQDSGDDLFIAMETDIDDRKFPSPVVKVTSEPQRPGTPQLVASTRVTMATTKLSTTSSNQSSKSRVTHAIGDGVKDVTGDSDEGSEVDVPITTPLSSPFPPSPKSKEQQADIFKELDSFGSDEIGRELKELGMSESQFDVSFGQIQTPSTQCSSYSMTHPELDKVWNSTSTDSPSPLRLAAAGGERSSRSNVQLEFEMPELAVSQLESSTDRLFNPLEAESPRTSLTKGQQGTPVKSGHVSMTSSLIDTRRQLLPRPTAGSREDGGNGRTKKRDHGRTKRRRSKCKDIPQLDGVNDRPSSSSSSTSSRKRKRTLGMQRGRKKRRRSVQPVEESNQLEKSASVGSVVTSDDTTAKSGGEEEKKETGVGEEEGSGESPVDDDRPSVVMNESLEEEVASWGAEVQVATGVEETVVAPPSNEGTSREDNGGCINDRNKKGGSSSDDSLPPTGKTRRRRLSLKKSASRTYRMKETIGIKPKALPSPKRGRYSEHLVAQALRSACVVKLDKLQKRKVGGNTSSVTSAEQPSCGTVEQAKTKTSPRRKKLSFSQSKSESEESLSGGSARERGESLSGGSARERGEGWVRKSRRRNPSLQPSPVMVIERMSFEQQIRKAIEMSKESYVAESAKVVWHEGEEVDSLSDQREEQVGSPLMFSPPVSDDLNRTVVEESPKLEEEGVVTSQDKGEIAAEGEVEGEGEGWNLDMTISSISESPPLTSSPQKEGDEAILHDSDLKLEMESSFTELDLPAHCSSPVHVNTSDEMNASIVSEGGFPVISLANKLTEDGETCEEWKEDGRTPPHSEAAAEPSYHGDKQDQKSIEFEAQLPQLLIPASPESMEREEEVDDLSFQADASIDQDGNGFHLAYSSSSEEEIVSMEGRGSPEPLDVSTEKTSSAVRLGGWVPLRERVGGRLSPERLHIKEREAAAVDVGVVNGVTGEKGWVCPTLDPPTLKELTESASMYNLRSVHHQQPFYSCPSDVQRPL